MCDMTTHEILNWRYATKKFDTSKELSAADVDYILAAGNLAATSYGLQPFGIVVVTDEAKKQALQEAAYGQAQVGTNGALLVICGRTDVNAEFIADYTARIEKIRGLEAGAIDGYKDMMTGDLTNRAPEDVTNWSVKQSYIVLGTMMMAAAERHIDGSPMEGFEPAKVKDILNLEAHNLHPATMFAIGYRSADDETQHYTKVRRELEDVVVRV